jgi:glycosyltransferase involved in cell wall biosynthesis
MSLTLFFLNTALLAITLINFATIRRPSAPLVINEKVTVLLPVRNEESNIQRVLGELEGQKNLSHLSILVVNDNSEDRTRDIALAHLPTNGHLIDAPPPQPGWLGKVNALHYGFNFSPDSDYYISIDADVHFTDEAIARAISTLRAYRLDFLSPYPRQIAVTWMERISQPLLQWSWMTTVILRLAEKFPLRSTVICNGQFLIVKGESLRRIGGFAPVATKVLDDIELGRALVESGYRGAVIDGSSLAETRMYSSFAEIKSGYGKSLHDAFGSVVGSLIAALFILSTGFIPLLLALTGNIFAIGALGAIIATRAIAATAASTRIRDSFLHPLSSLLFLYLLYFSWRNRGLTQWKGRTV